MIPFALLMGHKQGLRHKIGVENWYHQPVRSTIRGPVIVLGWDSLRKRSRRWEKLPRTTLRLSYGSEDCVVAYDQSVASIPEIMAFSPRRWGNPFGRGWWWSRRKRGTTIHLMGRRHKSTAAAEGACLQWLWFRHCAMHIRRRCR